MAAEGMDPSLLQDFLTEASELIEQLDSDLVTLESVAETPGAQDLLNQIFRALHTIKGAASFLGLTNLTTFAHAAEDALNRLRKGEIRITAAIMDALLKSTDVVRGMIQQLASGEAIEPGPQELIDRLHAIAEGKAAAPGASAPEPVAVAAAPVAAEPALPEGVRQLHLPEQKVDLLEFMVTDLKEQNQHLAQAMNQLRNPAGRADAAVNLAEVAQDIYKTADFFELGSLKTLVDLIAHAAPSLNQLHDDILDELLVRLDAMRGLIDEQAQALSLSRELTWPLETLQQRVQTLAAGHALPDDVVGRHGKDPQALLALDGVKKALATTQAAVANDIAAAAVAAAATEAEAGVAAPAAAAGPEAARSNEPAKTAITAEQTVRVEVGRLESLLNLVGQLVLAKNRFVALSRKIRDHDVPHELAEDMNGAANSLDRLTSELQVGVMRTRMQPLGKLFERYPRVIRDLARMTDKKINLQIVGKETEVDKSVLELLADPLVHILRNSADHGIEVPAKRLAAGKDEMGTIRLAAEHQGSHVRVEIWDDGKGLDRDVLGRKAIEKGLTTPEQLAVMSDEDVFRFIFAAGFSTAEKVTDLSGRGVGMDVVRTNISKLNGQVNVFSTKGKGTTIEILIPLTVAIMPAMVVGVGEQLYCVPLQSILEIVRPDPKEVHTVRGQPVMRLRDTVLPLVDLRRRLDETAVEDGNRFAVVVGVGNQRAGLVVDRLIGQQEIVIKPLDDAYTAGGPFSGATIREDGDVSLILDVIQLIRQTQGAAQAVEHTAA